MITSPKCVKMYSSAETRFLQGALDNFFKREFPKFFGPILREKLVNELIKILNKLLPLKDRIKPGQMVWNAVDISTRPDSKNCKFVPVILTIISEDDIKKLKNGVAMPEIRDHAIARILNETYKQGALLSMRDIGLFSWRQNSALCKYRINYEKKHNTTLPTTGSIQDMGTCISHKKIITKKVVIDKKDPLTVAQETNHSMHAVDRYLKDFYRVQYCFNDNKDVEFTTRATGLSKNLINQYFEILKKYQKNKNNA